MRPLHNRHILSVMRFFVGKANFCRTNWLIQKSLTKHTRHLISPEGKANRGQSSKYIIFELAKASPSNSIFQISPSLYLLRMCLLCSGLIMQNFFRLFISVNVLLLVFTGCTQEQKKRNTLDGKTLLEVKCASCHNLDIPAKTFPEEVAPPMMAVAFHIYDFIKVNTPAEKTPASIAFVKDYVFNPSKEKSFCDQKSLEDYGLMPSQKGKLTEEELEAIAIYMFAHYNQENFLKIMEKRRILRDMNPGERVARKHGCLSCHGIKQKKMGPSFSAIAARYKANKNQIRESIVVGSQERWKEARHAKMPSFKQLTNEELDTVTKWILER